MTNTELNTFNFRDDDIRVIQQDGEPWFVVADVCRVLGLQKPTMAVKPLASDERGKSDLPIGRGSLPSIVSESGLYEIVMQSRAETA